MGNRQINGIDETVVIEAEKVVRNPHEEIIVTKTLNNKGKILVAYSSTKRRLITFEIFDGDHKDINKITLWDLLKTFQIKLGHRSVITSIRPCRHNIIYAIELEKGSLLYDEGFDEGDGKNIKKSKIDKNFWKKEDGFKNLNHKDFKQGKKRKSNENVDKNHVNKLKKKDSLDKNKEKFPIKKNDPAGSDPNTYDKNEEKSQKKKNDSSIKIAYYLSSMGIPQFTFYLTDYRSLEEGKWINDLLIDWYLTYLYDKVLSDDDRQKSFFYSSLFFAILRTHFSATEKSVQYSDKKYSRVKSFIREDVNIFEKDCVIIPVNEDNYHWYLMIICFPGHVGLNPISNAFESNDKNNNQKKKNPCILVFDSLKGTEKYGDVRIVREYLSYQYFMKFGKYCSFSESEIVCCYPHIPMQQNLSDCGMYVLQYVESFFKNPIINYDSPNRLIQTWFTPIKVIKKRAKLAHMLRKMSRETVGKTTPVNLPKLKFPSLRVADKNRENYFSSEESLFSD